MSSPPYGWKERYLLQATHCQEFFDGFLWHLARHT